MTVSNQRASNLFVFAMTSLLLCLSWARGQDTSTTARNNQKVDEKTIRALIAQLGDDSFARRDEAQKKLVALGSAARTLVNVAAMDAADLEVRERASQVLKEIRALTGPGFWYPEANVFDIAYSKDGQSLAVACADRMVRIFDGKTNALRQTLKGHTATVYAVVFSSDSKTLVSCSGEFNKAPQRPGEIIVWDLATGTEIVKFPGPEGGLSWVALSPDEKFLYACSGGGSIRMWDPAKRVEVKAVVGHNSEPVRRLMFTPDGKLLASAGMDGTVRFWDPQTLEEVRQILAHPQGVGTLTFSRDGKHLFTAGRAGAPPTPGEIKVWDLTTFTEKTTIKGHTSKILSLAVSPDGALLAMSGGVNREFGEVVIFDLATGGFRATFLGHKEWVESVIFSPDGSWLASGGGFTAGSRGEIRLWDVKRLVAKGE